MHQSHLLFIPVYNCEKQIIRVIDKLLSSDITKNFREILIIDNRSNDKTFEFVDEYIIKKKIFNFKIVKNKENYNLGGTHKTGFNYAIKNNFNYVSILHGDDQGDINDLSKVFDNNIYLNYDCLLGSRFTKKSKLINYPKFRIYANWLINLAGSLVTFRYLTDLGSGLNMFKVEYIKNKFYLNFPNDLTFNYCLIFYICHSKSKFIFFPIAWSEDDQISNVKLFNHAFKWLRILLKFIFNRNKLFNNSKLKNQKYSFED